MTGMRNLKAIIIGTAIAVILAGGVLGCMHVNAYLATWGESRAQIETSRGCPTLPARLQVLRGNGIEIKSPVQATEYVFHSDVGGLGPCVISGYFALKVAPKNVDMWLTGYTKAEVASTDTAREYEQHLHLHGSIWRHHSQPEYYAFASVSVIVYRKEVIILGYQSQ